MIVDNEINIVISSTETRIYFIASRICVASITYNGLRKQLRVLKKTIKYVKRNYNFYAAKILVDGPTDDVHNIIKAIEKYGIMLIGVL